MTYDAGPDLRLTLRFDFDDERRLGPGKIALLEAIRKTGSISAAGREFSMSYRRAWMLTDEINKMFCEPLVIARGGGKNGGGAVVTALGLKIVDYYRAAERKAYAALSEEIGGLIAALKANPPE